MKPFSGKTIADLLSTRSEEKNNEIIYKFTKIDNDGGSVVSEISYRELDRKAKAIAVIIKANGIIEGSRILLLYPPGIELICAFFACNCSGAIPILAHPPINRKLAVKLNSIISDSAPVAVMSTNVFKKSMAGINKIKSLDASSADEESPATISISESKWKIDDLKWIATDEIQGPLSAEWRMPEINKNSLSFLQYTSGSTGHPKGVMISHENILHNLELLRDAEDCMSTDALVSWLPPYHDMGLIQGILIPLYAGAEAHLMSPLTFLKNPKSWLQAISRTGRHVISAAPNFAYDYCINKIHYDDRADLDLSRWKRAINGAEPIHADTLKHFIDGFARVGFSENAFCPGYGLAESTLFVSGSMPGRGAKIINVSKKDLSTGTVVSMHEAHGKTQKLVSSGIPKDKILIISPSDRQLLPPNMIGEVYHASISVAQGYWNNKVATVDTFHNIFPNYDDKQNFLKTGDLGFLSEQGDLFITGRVKDLLIINGMNYFPHDIELTVSSAHELIRQNQCICFSTVESRREQLVVVCEFSSKNITIDGPAISAAIIKNVGIEHELTIHKILLILPKKIPRTTSGKMRRNKCRELFESGMLAPTFVYPPENASSHSISREPFLARAAPAQEIVDWIIDLVKVRSSFAAATFTQNDEFVELGIDSLGVAELTVAIEKRLNIQLSPAAAIENPTPYALAQYIKNTFFITCLPENQIELSTTERMETGKPFFITEKTDEDLKNEIVGKMIKNLRDDKILGLHATPINYRPNYFDFKEISTQPMVGFQSCSYLNLEWDPLLTKYAIEAIINHGTQFSCSRAFVSVGSYGQLSDLLKRIFRMDPIISSSTTLGHLSALPALIKSNDIIIMDEQAHNSMQMAVKICLTNGTQIYKCKHGDMAMLETMVRDKNPGEGNRIWYIADGLYSMRGDFLDMPGLFDLMRKFPALYAYIDDAHSFGWLNDKGCGHVVNFYDDPQFEKIVVTGSLAKAFAAGGGCIFTKNEELHAKISVAGGPSIFSGPIQPASLGAAIGAATLFLSDRFTDIQKQLISNIQYARNVFNAYEVDFTSSGESPIFYVKIGVLEDVVNLCHYLYDQNYYVVPVGFPAVNYNEVGIRVCITRLHTHSELDGLVHAISTWNKSNLKVREARFAQKVLA